MTSPQPRARFAPGRLGGRLALGVIGLGFLSIGLGYNGAAGTIQLAAQLPYLVSGGLLGISLVLLGAAMLIVQAGREDRQRLETLLQALVEATAAATPAPRVPSTAEGLFAAGTASFHQPTCRLVQGRDDLGYLTAPESLDRGLKPCRVCQPVPVAAR